MKGAVLAKENVAFGGRLLRYYKVRPKVRLDNIGRIEIISCDMTYQTIWGYS